MEMEVVDPSTPAPGSTTDLRDRLQRARARLTEKRDDPGQDWYERARMVGKVEGVDLALAEVAEERDGSTLTLRQRLTDILDDLQAKYRTAPASKRVRIGGKVEGVKLALSYIHDGERMAPPAQPALVVTPAFVQRFETEYRWMIREQTKPLGQRDPLAAVRMYAVATVLADLLRASGVQGVPDGEPGSVLVALRDLLGMHDGQSFADDEVLVHAAEATDTLTLCREPVTDDTLVAIQDWRGHVTCRACREEAEL